MEPLDVFNFVLLPMFLVVFVAVYFVSASDRQHRKITKSYNDGYEWAASELLSGRENPDSIDTIIDADSDDSARGKSFNVGAASAAERYRRLMQRTTVIHAEPSSDWEG